MFNKCRYCSKDFKESLTYDQMVEHLKECNTINFFWKPIAEEEKIDKCTVKRIYQDESYVVRFYSTDIVTRHVNGDISLRHDGHLTKSTLRRLHLFTPFKIINREIITPKEETYHFYNGITFDLNFDLIPYMGEQL